MISAFALEEVGSPFNSKKLGTLKNNQQCSFGPLEDKCGKSTALGLQNEIRETQGTLAYLSGSLQNQCWAGNPDTDKVAEVRHGQLRELSSPGETHGAVQRACLLYFQQEQGTFSI